MFLEFLGIRSLLDAASAYRAKRILGSNCVVKVVQIWWKCRLILDTRRKLQLASKWDARLERMVELAASRRQKKLVAKLKGISRQKRDKVLQEHYGRRKDEYVRALKAWVKKKKKVETQPKIESVRVAPNKSFMAGAVLGKTRQVSQISAFKFSKETKKTTQKVRRLETSSSLQPVGRPKLKYMPTDAELEAMILSTAEGKF